MSLWVRAKALQNYQGFVTTDTRPPFIIGNFGDVGFYINKYSTSRAAFGVRVSHCFFSQSHSHHARLSCLIGFFVRNALLMEIR